MLGLPVYIHSFYTGLLTQLLVRGRRHPTPPSTRWSHFVKQGFSMCRENSCVHGHFDYPQAFLFFFKWIVSESVFLPGPVASRAHAAVHYIVTCP